MKKRRFVIMLVFLFAMTVLPICRAYASEGDEDSNPASPIEAETTNETAEETPEASTTFSSNGEPNKESAYDSVGQLDETEYENGEPDNVSEADEDQNTVRISPKANKRFGIIFVTQEKSKWDATTEVYYNSSIWFVILCVVFLVIDILILIAGVYIINRTKR